MTTSDDRDDDNFPPSQHTSTPRYVPSVPSVPSVSSVAPVAPESVPHVPSNLPGSSKPVSPVSVPVSVFQVPPVLRCAAHPGPFTSPPAAVENHLFLPVSSLSLGIPSPSTSECGSMTDSEHVVSLPST